MARDCLILNPAARGERARRFRQELAGWRREVEVKLTTGPGDARRLAADAVREGSTRVIAAGGDGTLNEVLNGIGDVPAGFETTALGVIPIGTVNVFAREVGIPLRVREAFEVLSAGGEARVDLPSMSFPGEPGCRRFFVQLAGAGLDARAISYVDRAAKRRLGKWAYLLAGWRVLRERRWSVSVTDGATIVSGELVLVGNGRYYGGQFPVFDRAEQTDGLLDVCVFPRVTAGLLAKYAMGFAMRRAPAATTEVRLQAPRLVISSNEPTPVQLEGELAGMLPVELTVVPQGLRVIVPQKERIG